MKKTKKLKPPKLKPRLDQVIEKRLEMHEAKDKFIFELAKYGYEIAPGQWVDRCDAKVIDIRDLDAKAFLIQENTDWFGMVGLPLGENGYFPLCVVDLIDPSIECLAAYAEVKEHEKDINFQIGQWTIKRFLTQPIAMTVILQVANYLIRHGHEAQAFRMNKAVMDGEFATATVAEALAIIQSQWAKTVQAKMEIAMIWLQKFILKD